MSDKHCNCGRCHCCNGYVQDADNPNRYVNLETGKEQRIDKKKWKLDWLILWFLIAFVLTQYVENKGKSNPNPNKKNPQTLVR
jgi:hypothetical protein